MNFDIEALQKKLSELLRWERRKRREQTLAALSCYALVAALVTLPLHSLLPIMDVRWLMPLLFFAALAPLFFRPWGPRDSARALARVDKTLRLDERTLTAWELLERHSSSAAALLVMKEAGEKLKSVNPTALSRRSWSWQAVLISPLLLLWLALVWFDVDTHFGSRLQSPPPEKALAQQLREFSLALQEKAKREGLRESLQVGRELEQAAQKGMDANTTDEHFKSELAGIKKRIEAAGKSAADRRQALIAESEQQLMDLKAELEAAQDLLDLPEAAKARGEPGRPGLDRLASLPQLKRQFDREGQARQSPGQEELKSYLDRLEQQVTGEMDRRALLDAERFLEQLMKQGQGEKNDAGLQVAGGREQESLDRGEKPEKRSTLPGSEPGSKETPPQAAPEFQAGAATHLKGLLGEGESSGLALRGKPSAGKSQVSEEEVIASYRRQAEAELNTERVPEALKETIKQYFLSLGMGEGAE